jgi:hypothetical protein
MFNLEQSISEWRKQMLAAGIKTPAPLEELEVHLREEIERQMKSGLGEPKAFEVSASRIGQPEILGSEFKKSEGTLIKTTGIFAAVVGAVIISRILTERPDASDRGVVRLWKLVGVGYSIFASGFSIFLTTICLAEPTISSTFTITDWILVLGANTASIFSIAGLRQGCRLLPVVQNLQVRMAIGIVGPLLGV